MWFNIAAKLVPGMIKTEVCHSCQQKKSKKNFNQLQKCVMQKRWLLEKLNGNNKLFLLKKRI